MEHYFWMCNIGKYSTQKLMSWKKLIIDTGNESIH